MSTSVDVASSFLMSIQMFLSIDIKSIRENELVRPYASLSW